VPSECWAEILDLPLKNRRYFPVLRSDMSNFITLVKNAIGRLNYYINPRKFLNFSEGSEVEF